MDAAFELGISYGQITVFDSALEKPFNEWTDRHFAQGFTWRPRSVSFRTLDNVGLAAVMLEVKARGTLRPDTLRAIQVPFSVPSSGIVEVASIGDSRQVQVSEGDYCLVYETGLDDKDEMWCSFSFIEAKEVQSLILKNDGELHPLTPLLMQAEPA